MKRLDVLNDVFDGDLERYLRWRRTEDRARAGLIAHDYCWGPKVGMPGCISCGCSEQGPCISHKPMKEPRCAS